MNLHFWINFFLEFFFTTHCCVCKKIGVLLCHECIASLSFYNRDCQFDDDKDKYSVHAVCVYEGVLREVLHYYKYEGIQSLGPVLAQIMYDHGTIPDADIITAVPLHHSKRLSRGFNQAQQLAEHLSHLKNIPYVELLERTTSVSTQARTTNKQLRKKNVYGLYSATPAALQLPHTTRVLIIDDVYTTGATIQACAQALKKVGIYRTKGMVLAHGI